MIYCEWIEANRRHLTRVEASVDEQITDLQLRHAHQDELIRKLDEAMREQSRRLDELAGKVEMLIQHVRTLGPVDDTGGGEEPPPPHY